MTGSLEMIQHCRSIGIMRKEASDKLLARRERLIKQAIKRSAFRMFSRAVKEAPKPGILARLTSPSLAGRRGGPSEWTDVGLNLAKMMGLAAATAGTTHGIYAAGKAISGKKLEKQISRSYSEMLEEYPRLKDEEPEKVRRPFGLLARIAPNLAAEPMVAGAFVYNNIQQGGVINHGDIKALADAQSAINSAQEGGRAPFFAAPQTAAQYAGKALEGS